MPRYILILLFISGPMCAWADPHLPPQKVMADDDTVFSDASDALRSKQYVQRTILSEVIQNTSRFNVGRLYVNHVMGFSSVWQRGLNWAKFSSGIQGLSVGYVTHGGHGFELGAEFSTVSNVFVGYRYFIRPRKFSLWPFVGVGVGTEVPQLNLTDGPPETRFYSGTKQMGSAILGLLIPLVDIGLKAELRFNFYGMDRIVFTQGIGAILFL